MHRRHLLTIAIAYASPTGAGVHPPVPTDTNVHHTNADVSATAGTDADVSPTTPADAYVHRTIDDATPLLADDSADTDAEGHAYPT